MNESEQHDFAARFSCPYSSGMDMDNAIERARALYRNGDLDAALILLGNLERKYVKAARLFDMLGDILVERGNHAEGRRYKALFETLNGTFKIAGGDGITCDMDRAATALTATSPVSAIASALTEAAAGPRGMPEFGRLPDSDEDVDAPGAEGLFPVTAAMAAEFIRQGHFDRAADIYGRLTMQHPEDENLREALERTRRISREKRVLGVLQGWLANIDKIKTSLNSGR